MLNIKFLLPSLSFIIVSLVGWNIGLHVELRAARQVITKQQAQLNHATDAKLRQLNAIIARQQATIANDDDEIRAIFNGETARAAQAPVTAKAS